MRRWIDWAARLYPARWRERYGAEFSALLDDLEPGWKDFLNVIGGALRMQMAEWRSYAKTAGVLGAVGAVMAVAASFVAPRKYTSTAVMRITSSPPGQPVSSGTLGRLASMEQEIMSRGSLANLIQRPALNLYRNERQRLPMEDIIEAMRKDVRIEAMEPGGANGARAFRIAYSYGDQGKAQAVVRELVTKFTEENVQRARILARTQDRPEDGGNLEVLHPASLPASPVGPSRVIFVAWGLGLGVLTGLLTALARSHPQWMFRMCAFGAAGCLAGLAFSLLIPDRYVSSAVMRLYSPRGTVSDAEMNAWLGHMNQLILSPESLAEVIQRPYLDLYARQRTQRPLERVVEEMRRKVRVERVTPSLSHLGEITPAFRIAFEYRDREKAQVVTRVLLDKFIDWNYIEQGGDGYRMEILDPASRPETSIYPNRFALSALGAAGLIAGALILRMKRALPPLSV